MRLFVLAAGLAAAIVPVAGASAQYYGGYGGYGGRGYGYDHSYDRGRHYGNDRVRREVRECRRELRHADSRREYRRELRECQREIARARYNNRWDRYDRDDRDDRRWRDRRYGW